MLGYPRPPGLNGPRLSARGEQATRLRPIVLASRSRTLFSVPELLSTGRIRSAGWEYEFTSTEGGSGRETVESTIVKRGSVAETEKVISEPFDFVLLDINMTNGETYDMARTLKGRDVPFAFVTATSPPDMPDEFRDSMIVTKPIAWERIQRAVLEAKERRKDFTSD